ncbi:MAG: hypothetical protein ABEN55_21650 [Bradymonadaceae bacterium]
MRTKREKYVLFRLDGYGAREAARRAGLAGGVPSPGARQLWKMVRAERGDDPSERAGQLRRKLRRHNEEIRQLQARIEEYEEMKAWLETKLEAVELLAEAETVGV